MKKLLLASLLATALAAVAFGDTIDKTVGGPDLGGPSLNKVHVVGVDLEGPLATSNTYAVAKLPSGAQILGFGVTGEGITNSTTVTFAKGAAVTSLSSDTNITATVTSTGGGYKDYPVSLSDGASNTVWGVSVGTAVPDGATLRVDILCFEP